MICCQAKFQLSLAVISQLNHPATHLLEYQTISIWQTVLLILGHDWFDKYQPNDLIVPHLFQIKNKNSEV